MEEILVLGLPIRHPATVGCRQSVVVVVVEQPIASCDLPFHRLTAARGSSFRADRPSGSGSDSDRRPAPSMDGRYRQPMTTSTAVRSSGQLRGGGGPGQGRAARHGARSGSARHTFAHNALPAWLRARAVLSLHRPAAMPCGRPLRARAHWPLLPAPTPPPLSTFERRASVQTTTNSQ